MALRASVLESGDAANLRVAMGSAAGDGNVLHGAYLADLAAAVARWHWDEAAELAARGVAMMGAEAVSDAVLVASGFNGITRVADAIGIRLDQHTSKASADFRAEIGIDAFAPTAKWQS